MSKMAEADRASEDTLLSRVIRVEVKTSPAFKDLAGQLKRSAQDKELVGDFLMKAVKMLIKLQQTAGRRFSDEEIASYIPATNFIFGVNSQRAPILLERVLEHIESSDQIPSGQELKEKAREIYFQMRDEKIEREKKLLSCHQRF